MVAERTGEQAEASTRQAHAAADLPAMREAEAKAAAALQRLTAARETLEREETSRQGTMAELDRRLVQLDADIERERRLAADAETALARLAGEEDNAPARNRAPMRPSARGWISAVAEADARACDIGKGRR
jgi:chromosome segregation protein